MRIVSGREALFPVLSILAVLLCFVLTATAVGVAEASTASTASTTGTLSISAVGDIDGAGAQSFIEVAAYNTSRDEDLVILRAFRDTLLSNPPGRFIVGTYYATSPPIAEVLAQNESVRRATWLLLVLPLVCFSAICLNPTAFAAFVVLILVILLVLRRHVKVLLKGIGSGALTSAAFTVTVFTLGALGYELPICAAIAAYLLPLIVPVAVAVCILVWIESRSPSKPRTLSYAF